MKLYQLIAITCGALKRCQPDWQGKHSELLDYIERERLPSGAGIDSGTKIDREASGDNVVILATSFHHMNDCGMYINWTEHRITVKPAFDGFDLAISGRNQNEIKDYLCETFHYALSADCEQCQQCGRLLPIIPKGKAGGTGYATDSEGRKVCYACCAEQDKTYMRDHDKTTLYLSKDTSDQWKVTNWPGSLTIKPDYVKRSKGYGFGREYDRHDVWFTFQGDRWHGINQGDNQLLRCRKLKQVTRVVFRIWQVKGDRPDCLALFPDLREASGYITSYQHVGQHSAADYAGCIASSRPAKPEEYADLAKELTQRGYNLRIVKHR